MHQPQPMGHGPQRYPGYPSAPNYHQQQQHQQHQQQQQQQQQQMAMNPEANVFVPNMVNNAGIVFHL